MNYDTAREAIDTVEKAHDATRYALQRVAKMLSGNLRGMGIDEWTLKELKRELRCFDGGRKKWKDHS